MADALRLKIELEGRDAQRALQQFSRSVQQTAQKSGTSLQTLGQKFTALRAAVAGAIGIIAVQQIRAFAQRVDALADRADKVTQLSRAFKTFGDRIEAGPGFLEDLNEATRGTVRNMELMRVANNAIVLGVAKSQEEFKGLAADAVRLGRAVGLDATQAIESFVTGVGRQSRLMLDNLGIIVKAEDAYRAYASSIGTTADKLTESERKLAFQKAAVEALHEGVKGLNEGTKTLGELWDSIGVSITNAVDDSLSALNRLPEIVSRWDQTGESFKVGFLASLAVGTNLVGALTAGLQDAAAAADALPETPDLLVPGADQDNQAQIAIDNLTKRIAELTAQSEENTKARAAELETIREQHAANVEQIKAETAARMEAYDFIAEQLEEEDRRTVALQNQTSELEKQQAIMDGFSDIDLPDFLLTDPQGPPSFIEDLNKQLRLSDQLAEGFADTLVEGLFEGKKSAAEMFKQLLKDLAEAIAKALILKAIRFGFGGGGLVGFEEGGIVTSAAALRAQHGLIVRGGTPGVDSVPILAQRGEAVLPKPLTDLLMETARGRRNETRGDTRAAEMQPQVTNHFHLVDATGLEDVLLRYPEAFGRGYRHARRRGAL